MIPNIIKKNSLYLLTLFALLLITSIYDWASRVHIAEEIKNAEAQTCVPAGAPGLVNCAGVNFGPETASCHSIGKVLGGFTYGGKVADNGFYKGTAICCNVRM